MFTTQPRSTGDVCFPHTTQSGCLVLSLSKRILHINASAAALISSLSGGEALKAGATGTSSLPGCIADAFHAILAEVEKRIAAEDWRQFEVRMLVPSSQGLLLARGFGIPDAKRRHQSRIVILLQQEPL